MDGRPVVLAALGYLRFSFRRFSRAGARRSGLSVLCGIGAVIGTHPTAEARDEAVQFLSFVVAVVLDTSQFDSFSGVLLGEPFGGVIDGGEVVQ